MKSEEIARIAGVSRSTVSRVINNYSNVPEDTRIKITKIIEQYGYEPNSSARVLAGKGLNTIGLFIVSIADKESENRIYQNNYFAPFVDTVIDAANSAGYYVLTNTVYSEKDYLKVKQAFLQKRIDCGIIVGTQRDTGVLTELSNKGYTLALIDYDVDKTRKDLSECVNLAFFNSMDYDGAVKAVEYLIGQGHKDIAILSGRLNTYSGAERYKAFKQTMQKHKLPVRKENILKGDFIKKQAYQEVKRLIKSCRLPTAIFASNDDMAITAIEAFKEEGIKVPEDISVIGFDDVPVSAQLIPALTTVRVPVYDIARKAVEHVINVVEKGSHAFSVYNFPTELVLRDSCRKVK